MTAVVSSPGVAVVGLDYDVVPYADAVHRPFVVGSMVEDGRADRAVEKFWRGARHPGSRFVVACVPGDPSTVMGWIVTRPLDNEIVFGYTRYPLRRRGIGRALALAAGIDFARPVGVWFWTRACERMFREHGYSTLFFKVCD